MSSYYLSNTTQSKYAFFCKYKAYKDIETENVQKFKHILSISLAISQDSTIIVSILFKEKKDKQ